MVLLNEIVYDNLPDEFIYEKKWNIEIYITVLNGTRVQDTTYWIRHGETQRQTIMGRREDRKRKEKEDRGI